MSVSVTKKAYIHKYKCYFFRILHYVVLYWVTSVCMLEHMCVSARGDSASDRGKAYAKKTAEGDWLKETLLCWRQTMRVFAIRDA